MEIEKLSAKEIEIQSPGIFELIKNHPVFEGVSEEELTEILPFFKLVSLPPGKILIEEKHARSKELYLVLTGNLSVIKKVHDSDEGLFEHEFEKSFTVATLKPGDAIGELSFLKGHARSATIKTVSESLLLSLSANQIEVLENNHPHVFGIMMRNLVGYVSERLKKTTDNEVRALKTELEKSILNSKANIFFSYVIGLLCFYNLFIHFIINLSADVTMASIVSAIIILIFCAGLAFMIKHSGLPVRFFGLTLNNWKQSLKESLAWTVCIIAFFVALKFILINTISRYEHLPLFDFQPFEQKYLAFNFILYGLHSPLQEFIARGVLQSGLSHFFTGKQATLWSIVISNALFAATHVHLFGGLLAVIVFLPGLFWGYLYARHQTLIGVSISHILIGWCGFFFLNLESILSF